MRYSEGAADPEGVARGWRMVVLLGFMALAFPGTARAQTGVEAQALDVASNLRVSSLDPTLEDELLGAWFGTLLPAFTPMELEANDCGAQTGDPAIDTTRAIPLCVTFLARHGPYCEVGVSVVLGTWAAGLEGPPAVRSAYLTLGHETLLFESLQRLSDSVGSMQEAVGESACVGSERDVSVSIVP